MDEGRHYSLERRENNAGSFLLCSVRDSGLKKHYVVFLEGKGLVGGWVLRAKKLRLLGVEPKASRSGGGSVSKVQRVKLSKQEGVSDRSFAEVVSKNRNSQKDVIQVKVGDEEVKGRFRFLYCCLVGG